jgi:hypothetical protein
MREPGIREQCLRPVEMLLAPCPGFWGSGGCGITIGKGQMAVEKDLASQPGSQDGGIRQQPGPRQLCQSGCQMGPGWMVRGKDRPVVADLPPPVVRPGQLSRLLGDDGPAQLPEEPTHRVDQLQREAEFTHHPGMALPQGKHLTGCLVIA